MTTEDVERPYTLRALQQMLGVSRAVISGFVDAGFIAPARGPRNELRFGFQDVVLLRTACDLQAASVPPGRILRSLRRLRANLPAELPLSGLRITAVGNDIAVRRDSEPLATVAGQLLFDFDVAPVAGAVAFLPHAVRAEEEEDKGIDDIADASRWFAVAEAHESAGNVIEAEAAYRQSITLRPDDGGAYLNLGALLCEESRFDDAVLLYDEALALRPRDALLHFNRAIALEDLRRYGEAIASYERSVALAPDLADAHFNAARLHQELGHAQKAVRHFSAYRRLQK